MQLDATTRTARRRHRAAVILAAATATLLGVAACSDDDGPGGGAATTPTTAADAAPATPDTPGDPTAVRLVDQELELEAPIDLVTVPEAGDVLIAERAGRVRVATVEGGRLRLVDEPVLDLRGRVGSSQGERGLLGIEVAPDRSELYVNYTGADRGETRVEAYRLTGEAGAWRADPGDRRELLVIEQPFANHNGGDLAMGPDDMLYVATGDGGAAGDPEGRAQDPASLLGKLLRLDPLGRGDSDGDGIPDGNPFTEGGERPEVWALGLRNPWRISFDPATGALWVADVGQDRWEEVNSVPAEGGAPAAAGANFGWDLFEGDEEFADPDPSELSEPPFVAPVLTYRRDGGACAVTGGVVVRDPDLPALDGHYVFGDFCRPGVRALPPGERGEGAVIDLDDSVAGVASFGTGPSAEVYVLSLDAGIFRLTPA